MAGLSTCKEKRKRPSAFYETVSSLDAALELIRKRKEARHKFTTKINPTIPIRS